MYWFVVSFLQVYSFQFKAAITTFQSDRTALSGKVGVRNPISFFIPDKVCDMFCWLSWMGRVWKTISAWRCSLDATGQAWGFWRQWNWAESLKTSQNNPNKIWYNLLSLNLVIFTFFVINTVTIVFLRTISATARCVCNSLGVLELDAVGLLCDKGVDTVTRGFP